MSYHFVSQTPGLTAKWQRIVRSDPQRLVRALLLEPENGTTPEGDSVEDIMPILEVLKELSSSRGKSKNPRDGPDPLWYKLVDNGIIEQLCLGVLAIKTHVPRPPGMKKREFEQAKNQLPTAYYFPLEIICNGIWHFKLPPSAKDIKVIDALKIHWSSMMERLWTEPDNTLRPEQEHVTERIVITEMLYKIIPADPSFLEIIYEDLTIPVITRHWKHATDEYFRDLSRTGGLLEMLFTPEHSSHIAYAQDHPPPTSKIISKIIYGASPTPTSENKDVQLTHLVDSFAQNLSRTPGPGAGPLLNILAQFLHEWDEGFVTKLRSNETFWGNLVWLFRRARKTSQVDAMGHTTSSKSLTTYVLYIISQFVNEYSKQDRQEVVRYVLEAGLFDAMDEAMDDILEIKDKTELCRSISRFIFAIQISLSEADTAFKRFLTSQLPRPRILGSLLIYDIKNQNPPGKPSVKPERFRQLSWQLWAMLTVLCVPHDQCARRSCGGKSKAKCASCKGVAYCGAVCQKMDWKDHKVICKHEGSMNAIQTAEETAPRILELFSTQEELGKAPF